MKQLTIPITTLLIAALPLSARTWTSNDGAQTFEADFKSYDAATEKVTVHKGFKSMTFTMDKLSVADQEWVKEEAKKLEAEAQTAAANSLSIEDQLEEQKVGKNLNSKVLSRLEGKKFAKAELEKVPEYYLLYFTASW